MIIRHSLINAHSNKERQILDDSFLWKIIISAKIIVNEEKSSRKEINCLRFRSRLLT
jgi:hypothetical protein